VAAGRYTPEIVYLQLNLDRANDAANNSEINEEEIVYGENTANIATVAENFNQSVKEVEEFLKLTLTKKEQNYHRVNLHRKEEIKRKMERACDLVNHSVYDKKLHRELRNQISNDIAVFTGEDLNYPKPTHERDAAIRHRKENKNKKDMIKLQQLLDTFRIAKHHDRQVKELINKRI
jgi:UDP-N-acetylglucosamine 2-epimerase